MAVEALLHAIPIASLHCVVDCTRAILIAESLARATVCPPSLPWGAACGAFVGLDCLPAFRRVGLRVGVFGGSLWGRRRARVGRFPHPP